MSNKDMKMAYLGDCCLYGHEVHPVQSHACWIATYGFSHPNQPEL
jgi:hypothetical protein